MEKTWFSGYLLQGAKELIKTNSNAKLWSQVSKNLSSFSVLNPNLNSADSERETPLLTVIDNQISRGLPTIPSIFVEERISELLKLTEKSTGKIGDIHYRFKSEHKETAQQHLKAFAIVDTRLNGNVNSFSFQTWEEHAGSDFERKFYNDKFNELFGNCSNQMLEMQRSMNSILEQPEREEQATRNQLANLAVRFFEQKTDFVLQFPEIDGFAKGLILEIDGSQHRTDENQTQLDKSRDHFASQKGWETIRIPTTEVNSIPQEKKNKILKYLDHPFAGFIKSNIQNPLASSELGRKYLQAFLSPLAIARVQKVLIKSFKKGLLDLSKSKVSIGIIERDVPCGFLAIEDLLLQLNKLSILQSGKAMSLPEIELKIFTTEQFKTCELNSKSSVSIYNPQDNFENFDLLIDVSVLSTKYYLDPPSNSIPRRTVVIRSIHSNTESRKFNFCSALAYPDLSGADGIISPNKKEALEFFIQSLFRKQSYRPGQIEILNKALQKKNPIALLPTGAGKSLTYQLASLLQPGLTVVVDPIKSLMKDQNENLINACIDATIYINSSLTPTEREVNTKKFADGEFLFAFVSPERFIVSPFRNKLTQMANNSKIFSYCVIDEAHCVSEWGHDFRTAYLRLGENARNYCPTGSSEKVAIIGLTGTASFDVLSDVQREVHLIDETAIIRPEKLEREELNFRVKVFNSTLAGVTSDRNKKTSISSATHQVLSNLLNNDLLDEFNARTFQDFVKPNGDLTNCGIIFCPHKGGDFGVKKIAELLRANFPEIREAIGEYYGGGDGGDKTLDETQDKFKNNQISVLVATKAFGMGIDKPNVRFTIHLTHPISIEGFYQEAGRAGRDREKAACYILHSENLLLNNGNSAAKDIQESFLNNSFRGPDNEKAAIFELLDRITYPHTPNINQITSRILSERGRICKLALFPKAPATPHTIYVNGEEFKTDYGKISIGTLTYTPSSSIVSIPEAVEILEEIKSMIENRPEGISALNWLHSINETAEEPGIETLLLNIPFDQEQAITIGFENNGIQNIADFISNYDTVFDYSLVLSSLSFCFTFNDFTANLNRDYWKATNRNFSFTPQILDALRPLYEHIRLDQDTFKAVYRLSILGVVKDYVVNYNSSTISLTCQRLNDQQILDNLVNYVSRYVTTIAASGIREDVVNRDQETMLRKCIDFLIDFTYDKIFIKRKNALSEMERCIRVAVQQGNSEFAEEINNYFDSQYVIQLRDATNAGKDFDFDILFKFIKDAGETIDKLRQLRSSARRLTIDNPDNPVFYWLSFYASLLLKDRQFTNLQDDFKQGLRYYKTKYEYNEIDHALKQLNVEIENHDGNSVITFAEVINLELVDLAIEGVKNINLKILNNYV